MSMHKPLYLHHSPIMAQKQLQLLLRHVKWLLLEVGRWLLGRLLHVWVLLMVRVLLVVVLLLLLVMVVVRHIHNR